MERTALAGLAFAALIETGLTTSVAAAGPPAGVAPRAGEAVTAAFDVVDARQTAIAVHNDLDRPVITAVPMGDEWFTLVLEPSSVRSAHYRVLVQQDDGTLIPAQAAPQRTFRGSVLELPGSIATGTLLDDGLHARIVSGADEYWVQPVCARLPQGKADEYIIYHAADVVPQDGQCACAAPQELRHAAEAADEPPMETSVASTLCVAELAVDVDSEFLAAYGSVGAAEDQVNAVINAVNVQYERDVGITHEITTIIVRTAETDPYTTNDAGALLGQFRSQWEDNHDDVPRDLAHLFTGKNLDGSVVGIAYVSVICSSVAYGLSQSDCCGSMACGADLVAHEMGHNWSASHCSCSGYTMNPSLTCGGQFHPTETAASIVAFRDSRSCLDCSEPPVCGDAGAGGCEQANGTPSCDDADCCTTVCAVDVTCCDVEWDQACADLAADLCGGGPPQDRQPEEAVPTNLQITRGTLLSGSLSQLMASDNDRVRVRSQLQADRERADVRVTCTATSLDVSRVDVTVELGGNLDGVDAFVYLRNYVTSRWDRLERLDLPTSDATLEYLDVPDPESHLNSNGKLKVRVMSKIASGSYVLRIDHVEVMVTP